MYLKGIAKFFQSTSLGSGAISVTHIIGLDVCWDWAAKAAPQRDLNVTKATGSSYKDEKNGNNTINSNSITSK